MEPGGLRVTIPEANSKLSFFFYLYPFFLSAFLSATQDPEQKWELLTLTALSAARRSVHSTPSTNKINPWLIVRLIASWLVNKVGWFEYFTMAETELTHSFW
jgi:hypothetical protein